MGSSYLTSIQDEKFLFLLATGLVCFEGVQGATRSKCYGPQIFFASDAEEEDEPVPVPITIEKNKTLADIPAMTKEWTTFFLLMQKFPVISFQYFCQYI